MKCKCGNEFVVHMECSHISFWYCLHCGRLYASSGLGSNQMDWFEHKFTPPPVEIDEADWCNCAEWKKYWSAILNNNDVSPSFCMFCGHRLVKEAGSL